MAFVIIRRKWDEDYGYDGAYIDEVVCGFDYHDQCVSLLESHGLKPDVNYEFESNYCRGKDRVPDTYIIKEIPYNDVNLEGTYENNGKTWIPFNTPKINIE